MDTTTRNLETSKQKEEWEEHVKKKLEEYYKTNIETIFKANQVNGNRYFFDPSNQHNYLVGDIIFKLPKAWFIFEFLTKQDVHYIFSPKNKNMWEINKTTKTKKAHFPNWNEIFRKKMILLFKTKQQIVVSCLMAHDIDFHGCCDGVYGATPDSFNRNFLKIVDDWILSMEQRLIN